MSETAALLIDAVLERVRDPGGLGHSRAFVLGLLNYTQTVVNGMAPGVGASLSLTIENRQVLYPLTGHPVTPVLRVDRVQDGDRDLRRVDWQRMAQADRQWLRAVGGRPECWARVGHDLLAIWPNAPGRVVTVYYTPTRSTFTSEADVSTTRDDRWPATLALTEALCLLRQRDAGALPEAVERFKMELAKLPSVTNTGVAPFTTT